QQAGCRGARDQRGHAPDPSQQDHAQDGGKLACRFGTDCGKAPRANHAPAPHGERLTWQAIANPSLPLSTTMLVSLSHLRICLNPLGTAHVRSLLRKRSWKTPAFRKSTVSSPISACLSSMVSNCSDWPGLLDPCCPSS